jgi:hypothetical protein
MDRAENKILITQSDQAAFFLLKLKNHPRIKIVEQFVDRRLGWEIDASPEVYELLREYENNPLVPLMDFVNIAKRTRVQILVWQSLPRKQTNGASR